MNMKSKEKDIDFSEENFKKQFKRLDRSERPNALIEKSLRESKKRITIYLDADIIEFFKNSGKTTREGYQTLINKTLRQAIGAAGKKVHDELLEDRNFLAKLKTELGRR